MPERRCEDCGRRMEDYLPRKRNGQGQRVCPACAENPGGGLVNQRESSYIALSAMQVVAHDTSGHPTRVFHCPFCGSGQIVGGPNGIDCVFCGETFTVQKQPKFVGIPQTQNGLETPPPRTEQDRIDDYEHGVEPNPPMGPRDTTPAPENQKPEVIVETTAKKYTTVKGAPLDRDKYLRHLAINFGEDKDAVLAEIKESRGK